MYKERVWVFSKKIPSFWESSMIPQVQSTAYHSSLWHEKFCKPNVEEKDQRILSSACVVVGEQQISSSPDNHFLLLDHLCWFQTLAIQMEENVYEILYMRQQ